MCRQHLLTYHRNRRSRHEMYKLNTHSDVSVFFSPACSVSQIRTKSVPASLHAWLSVELSLRTDKLNDWRSIFDQYSHVDCAPYVPKPMHFGNATGIPRFLIVSTFTSVFEYRSSGWIYFETSECANHSLSLSPSLLYFSSSFHTSMASCRSTKDKAAVKELAMYACYFCHVDIMLK